MGWDHLRKPSGGPGHGPSNGPGLWGDKKGAGHPDNRQFEQGNRAAAGRPPAGEGQRAMNDRERAQIAKDHLFELIKGAQHEMTGLRAAAEFLNRVEGLPVARNINLAVNDLSQLDDDALARQQQELERAIRAASEGAAQADDTQEP